uniref:Uncharacterized protein n=1 Tax=Lepeophtheirus salmonis TaxID=72036 RepID=A0A0K2TBK1_LEPSM
MIGCLFRYKEKVMSLIMENSISQMAAHLRLQDRILFMTQVFMQNTV